MTCPVCKKTRLKPVDLLPDLNGRICETCSGVWVDRAKYEAWRARQPADLPENDTPVQLAVAEVRQAKICPRCARLLLPYRVGHGLAFSIDYCGGCGGVWCDGGEWDALKSRNLHDNLHDVVTKNWQSAVRQAGVQEAIEQTCARHLGEHYAKAKDAKAWLAGLTRDQRTLVLAYLSDSPL